ncbi:hypothetical protein F4810DRAFT_390680 [Camillea tinctor]|nr:hypothetical protein F4810DRAFT_390680 [Camillea tinctor]
MTMTLIVRSGQFALSESSCTEATTDDQTAADSPLGAPTDSAADPIPTTFSTAIRSPRPTVPSSPHPAVRLVSRSETRTAIGAGVGGGLGGALLLGLIIFLFIRYRRRWIPTEAEEGKAISPEPPQQPRQEEQEEQPQYYHHHQGYDDSRPKPEGIPSPISGPEVYKKPETPSLSDHQEHVESTPSGPIELEAAPVPRARTPSLQGGHYTDHGGNEFTISEAPAPVPVELPGTEVSIAELESPHLTASSPTTTTITVLSAAPTIMTATTATTPTTARASSSGRGVEATAHHQQQQPPRTPASLASRAISPSSSMFSYNSAAPSEIHSLNEDAPRVLNAEERRRQLVALQEEARRREEGPLRRI